MYNLLCYFINLYTRWKWN